MLVDALPEKGREFYEDVVGAMKQSVASDFSFTTANLYRIGAAARSAEVLKADVDALKAQMDERVTETTALRDRVVQLESRAAALEQHEAFTWYAANRDRLLLLTEFSSTEVSDLHEMLKWWYKRRED